jgi:hypothetical protein
VLILLPLLAFVFASLLVTAGAMALSTSSGTAIERRLGEVTGTRFGETVSDAGYSRALTDTLKRLGTLAPKSPTEMGKLQQRLVVAGFRRKEALLVLIGIRVALGLALFALLATPVLGPAAAASHPTRSARRPRPSGGERRSGARPRSGDSARG